MPLSSKAGVVSVISVVNVINVLSVINVVIVVIVLSVQNVVSVVKVISVVKVMNVTSFTKRIAGVLPGLLSGGGLLMSKRKAYPCSLEHAARGKRHKKIKKSHLPMTLSFSMQYA